MCFLLFSSDGRLIFLQLSSSPLPPETVQTSTKSIMALLSRRIPFVMGPSVQIQVRFGFGQRPLNPRDDNKNTWKDPLVVNKYSEPKFDQKVLLAACEPIIARDRRPMWEQCKLPEYLNHNPDPHPYEVLLAKELKEEMNNTDFIAFYHMDSLFEEHIKIHRNNLTRKGFQYRRYNRLIYKMATEGTKFASLTEMLHKIPNTMIVMSDKSTGRTVNTSAQQLLQLDKKMFGYVLMFAFAEDRLIRKDEIVALAQMPSLQAVRGQVYSTINQALVSLSSSLTYHQSLLSMSLDQLVKREDQKTKETKVDEAKSQNQEK